VTVSVTAADGSTSVPVVKSSIAATVRIAGAAPVLTLAVAPALFCAPEMRRFPADFIFGSSELSFKVNCEEGAAVKVSITRAVLVAASTEAGHVYLRMSTKIARIASLHFTSFHIGYSIGLSTWNKRQRGFLLKPRT
jgi:hypothetical protein